MADTDQIEVLPDGDGWQWQKTESGHVVEGNDGYSDRSSALAAAREANGGGEVTLTRPDGTPAGTAQLGGRLRVVLLRADGSLVGEIDPPAGAGGQAQSVTLSPASESGEVVTDG